MGRLMSYIRILILGLVMTFGLFDCKSDNPVQPVNHNPVIHSVTVFPQVVGPMDSLLVTCEASDPDGDALVYDWYTTPVVTIKGAEYPWYALFNTHVNYAVFYAPVARLMTGLIDTAMVTCAARDGKGGMAVKDTFFIIERDSSSGR